MGNGGERHKLLDGSFLPHLSLHHRHRDRDRDRDRRRHHRHLNISSTLGRANRGRRQQTSRPTTSRRTHQTERTAPSTQVIAPGTAYASRGPSYHACIRVCDHWHGLRFSRLSSPLDDRASASHWPRCYGRSQEHCTVKVYANMCALTRRGT